MVPFRIVPVVDVKNGLAVHAVKGQRNAYAPVNCSWCKGGDLNALVRGYKEEFGLHDLYIADLDAITAKKPNKAICEGLLAMIDGEAMIDAGISSIKEFREIASMGFRTVILGTESTPSVSLLQEIIEHSDHDVIVSLDVKDDAVLSPANDLGGTSIKGAFRIIERMMPAAIIFLDLSGVGARTGINPVARDLACEAELPLYLGGGTRSASDLHDAQAAGFAGVLVASALQDGSVSASDLSAFVT